MKGSYMRLDELHVNLMDEGSDISLYTMERLILILGRDPILRESFNREVDEETLNDGEWVLHGRE
jgi:hypothetical protein